MVQALQNLLDNAIRYSTAKSEITCNVAASDGNVEISVEDEGPAIPPADRKRIFERFVRGGTGSRVAEGTGLGLAIVQRVAEIHQGTVSLDNPHGKGNRFTLHLSNKTLTGCVSPKEDRRT